MADGDDPRADRRRPGSARVDDDHRVHRRRTPSGSPARLRDRFADQHLATPMQKIVGDTLRPEGRTDPEGVGQARRALDTAYEVLDNRLADGRGPAATRSRSPTADRSRTCSTCAPPTAGTPGTRTSRATTAICWLGPRSPVSWRRRGRYGRCSHCRGRRTRTTSDPSDRGLACAPDRVAHGQHGSDTQFKHHPRAQLQARERFTHIGAAVADRDRAARPRAAPTEAPHLHASAGRNVLDDQASRARTRPRGLPRGAHGRPRHRDEGGGWRRRGRTR